MKLVPARSPWGMTLIYDTTGVLIRKKGEDNMKTDTQGEHMMTKAGVGMLLPQAKECLEPREAVRGKKDPSLEAFSADPSISDFRPLEL